MGRQRDLLHAEPLEHAGLGCDSWYEGSDVDPVLMRLGLGLLTMSLSRSV